MADPSSFMEKSVDSLKKKLDHMIYYGISKGVLKPPMKRTEDDRITHLMRGINMVFKSKLKISQKQAKAENIFHIIEDMQSDDWQRKRSNTIPGLVVSENGAALLLGRKVLMLFKEHEMLKAVAALVGTFYLLDFDYPLTWQVSLSVLQRIIFGDEQVNPDSKEDIVKAFIDIDSICTGK